MTDLDSRPASLREAHMRLIGIELHKPSPADMLFGGGVMVLVAILLNANVNPSAVGAMAGGVVASLFGVKAFRSAPEFLVTGCCGVVGAILCQLIASSWQ